MKINVKVTAQPKLVSPKMMKINVKLHSGSFQRRTTTSLEKTNGRLTFDKLLTICNLDWNRTKTFLQSFLREHRWQVWLVGGATVLMW